MMQQPAAPQQPQQASKSQPRVPASAALAAPSAPAGAAALGAATAQHAAAAAEQDVDPASFHWPALSQVLPQNPTNRCCRRTVGNRSEASSGTTVAPHSWLVWNEINLLHAM